MTINKDITLTSSNGSTLDFGSYALSGLKIAAGSSVIMNGDLVATGSGTQIIDVAGTFTLAGNARIEQTKDIGAYAINNNGTVQITGGQVISSFRGINNYNRLTISGGMITGVEYGIRIMSAAGYANISSGTIQGDTIALFLGSSAKAEISGGTFTGAGITPIALDTSGTCEITGGTFTGIVRTNPGGTLDVDLTGGNVSIPNGISFLQSGHTRKYINTIPEPVTIKEGETDTIVLEGVFSGIYYSIDSEETPAELGASISNNIVTLDPSAPGNYLLVMSAQETTGSAQTLRLTLPVTVTAPIKVCAIDSVQYETIDDALAAVGEGETKTIRLLTDITYTNGIVIDGRTIIFDLDGHTLNVSNPSGTGLDVQKGGQVSYIGTGSFNVSGTEYGVRVVGENSSAVVNNVSASGNSSTGVYADSAGAVTVNGDTAHCNYIPGAFGRYHQYRCASARKCDR